MLAQTSKQKKIMNIIEKLSPEKLDKVIDFAEFLKERREPQQKIKGQVHLLKIPEFHLGRLEKEAADRNKLYREYLDRKFD